MHLVYIRIMRIEVNRERRSAMSDRYVTKHPRGWAVQAPGAKRASSVHATQREAEAQAKRTVGNLGGGEVRIQGQDGRWRDSDTVAPGNDPNPPRDKKH
jgi:Uncharacterized protein conserved in bacteria (DUF2188)